jgi:transcriptional accessory protein Tex/SPT6
MVHISELSTMHVESPEQIVQVGDQVQVKVIDVDVSRRRISLSMRQVGDVAPAEVEIEAEPTEQLAEEVVPELEVETREVLADAAARGDEGSQEELEAVMEPEPLAPEEAALHEEPGVAEPAEEEEEISLESILRDLKRREGRE